MTQQVTGFGQETRIKCLEKFKSTQDVIPEVHQTCSKMHKIDVCNFQRPKSTKKVTQIEELKLTRAIPRFEQTSGPLVKVTFVLGHGLVSLPCLGNHRDNHFRQRPGTTVA